MTPLPPRSTLFPYTTLFRSRPQVRPHPHGRLLRLGGDPEKRKDARARERQQVDGGAAPRGPGSRVGAEEARGGRRRLDRKSTRLNSSHGYISYAVFCLKKKK